MIIICRLKQKCPPTTNSIYTDESMGFTNVQTPTKRLQIKALVFGEVSIHNTHHDSLMKHVLSQVTQCMALQQQKKEEEKSSCPSPLLNQAGSTSCVAALFNDKKHRKYRNSYRVKPTRLHGNQKRRRVLKSYPSNFIHRFEEMGNIDSQMEQSVRRTTSSTNATSWATPGISTRGCVKLCTISIQKLRLLRVKPNKSTGRLRPRTTQKKRSILALKSCPEFTNHNFHTR